jgi:hypothetical protein
MSYRPTLESLTNDGLQIAEFSYTAKEIEAEATRIDTAMRREIQLTGTSYANRVRFDQLIERQRIFSRIYQGR